MKKAEETQKKMSKKAKDLEDKIKNAKAVREKELKEAEDQVTKAKKKMEESSRKMKEKYQVMKQRNVQRSTKQCHAVILHQQLSIFTGFNNGILILITGNGQSKAGDGGT